MLRRYPLRRHRLSVAAGTLSIVAPDAGAWLHTGGWSARAAAGSEPPYWADIWPASVAIARWLSRRTDLAGCRALDLGCGIGVPGTAAARGGAHVVFADRQADALAFAAFNAGRNGAGPGQVVTCVHDWAAGPVPGPFDLLLLADVTYRPLHHAPVLRQIRDGLGALGIAVHADPYRRESDGFVRQLHGEFCCHEVDSCTYFDDARVPVRLVFLARDPQALARFGLVAAAPGPGEAP